MQLPLTEPPQAKSPQDTQVIVGLSGGVDSSVSALLLQQQGYQVAGLFMKNWDEDDGTDYCTAKADFADAQAVCDRLGIPLHQANFAAEYWDRVFEHFLHEYRQGRTPNPDILCNTEIKFDSFLHYAYSLGADCIATGHYVQTQRQPHTDTYLLRGLDANKDQSYFLHAVSSDALARTLFPIGALRKPQVRQLAQQHRLAVHDKKDSTGICFIGQRRFKTFLQRYLPAQPGQIITPQGTVMGEHQGLMYYTLGQRKGLGIGGTRAHEQGAWFVAEKRLERNELVVVQGEHPLLYSQRMRLAQIHWIACPPAPLPLALTCKHRYRQPDQRCLLSQDEQGYCVEFEQPQRAVTPGQSAVFYHGQRCLGGGVIVSTDAVHSDC